MAAQQASDTAAIRRQLRIKSGVVQRLWKENKSYRKEEEDLARKLEKFIADKAEDWDIKNTRNMRDESQKLVADTLKRLRDAVQDLRDLIVLSSLPVTEVTLTKSLQLGTEENSVLGVDDEELVKAKGILELHELI